MARFSQSESGNPIGMSPEVLTPRRLAFATPPPGSEHISALFRAGILRYLVPLSVGLILCYLGVELSFGRPPSPFVYLLLAITGGSFALSKLGRTSNAVAVFTVGTYFTLLLYAMPILGQPNGFSTGSAYTFCMFPIVAWMSYADRLRRLVAVGLTLAGLTLIFWLGQPASAQFAVPGEVFTLGFVRSVFLVAVTLGAVRVVDVAIAGFSERNARILAIQEQLNLQLANRQRDIEREARSHKATLAHLARSETRFRHLFDKAFDGIILFDGDASKPIEINDAIVKRLGYDRDYLVEATVLSVSPERQADGRLSTEVRAELVERLDAGETITYDWLHRARSGEIVDFEITTFPLPEEGNIRVSVFADVTEERLAKRKLTEANRELRTFAHAASHDLKEPLRTMSNFAKLIERRYSDVLDDNGREYLGFIMDAAARGTTLVQDLLEYAELGTSTADLKVVDLQAVALTVRQTVAARLTEEGAELAIGQLPEVVATPTWARQLLQNLVSNALKFKRPGVTPRVEVTATSDRFGHEIHVRDNGIGIAPDDLERVFGVFQRLVKREEYEGNGIGLALCRRIMAKVDGDIRVASTLGEGTTFTLWFPNHGMVGACTEDDAAVATRVGA